MEKQCGFCLRNDGLECSVVPYELVILEVDGLLRVVAEFMGDVVIQTKIKFVSDILLNSLKFFVVQIVDFAFVLFFQDDLEFDRLNSVNFVL